MRKILLFSCVLIIFATLVFFFNPVTNPQTVSLSGTEKTKALEKVLGRQANTSDPKNVGFAGYTGSYFHIAYPENANLHPTAVEKSADILDSFGFNTGVPSVSVSVQAQKTDVQSLSDIPGVALRLRDTTKYREGKTTLDGQEGTLFLTTDSPYESVLFVLKNGVLYTLSAVGITEQDVRASFEKARLSFSFSS